LPHAVHRTQRTLIREGTHTLVHPPAARSGPKKACIAFGCGPAVVSRRGSSADSHAVMVNGADPLLAHVDDVGAVEHDAAAAWRQIREWPRVGPSHDPLG
jgi:hypothetical protein